MSSAALAQQRIIAWLIDAAIIVGLVILFEGLGRLAGAGYLLVRDGLFEGQSLGKRIMGLKVVAHRQRLQCTVLDSIVRNLLWVVPLANVVMGLTGLHALAHDARGRHWGDRLANTWVVKAAV